jgi:hypothetical protein
MSNKQQTAVEWLQVQLNENGKLSAVDFYQAKELEKQQIMAAYSNNGWNDDDPRGDAEQYYNETYKTKNP